MKEKAVLVFIPDNLNTKQPGYLKGYSKNNEVFYITSNEPTKSTYQSVGFIGQSEDYVDIPVYIDIANEQVIVNNNKNIPITQIIYDYKRFKNSDIVYKESERYGEHFKYLSNDIRKSTNSSSENGRNFIVKYISFIVFIINYLLKGLGKLSKIFQQFSTLAHFEDTIKSTRWFLNSVMEERKLSPKLGNMILAKCLDLGFGIFLTRYVLDYEEEVFTIINSSTEHTISNLRGLLIYLMGQPIGLKLNHGFNNFLGQFFLYHISLWKIFLIGINPIITSYFRLFVLTGYLGFSYQIAMISDVVSIVTFHSYCIYVYAARLFNLQLRCLISLWRLLIGRKFNPLRNRVDSCQYSQDQLFIGTLTFTILLFLFPTTTMYYVVFLVFRLITLFINELLLWGRNLIYINPLYSLCLWAMNSSSIAGNIHIIWKSFDNNDNVKIEAKLEKLPIMTTIKQFMPELVSTTKNQKSMSELFHNSITGTLL